MFPRALTIILFCVSGVVLIALQIKPVGWALWLTGALFLLFCPKQFRREFFLLYLALGFLGIAPISTDISYVHMLTMATPLAIAVVLPYCVSRFWYRDYLVRFPWHHGRQWYRHEIAYIAVTAIITYVLLPFYFDSTHAYQNWLVQPGVSNITRLFIGTNALGIWDELFFISTVLGILKRYMRFRWANMGQAVLFTSFLYELGFTGWGFIPLYFFALLQGSIFHRTESLLYVVTIHLTLDFVLFLALLHAHHPTWMPIFIT